MGGTISKEEVKKITNDNNNKPMTTSPIIIPTPNTSTSTPTLTSTPTNEKENKDDVNINIIDDFVNLRNYLINKVPYAVGVGGIIGSSVGYLAGNGLFLHGYFYSFGLGFLCTSYYSGVYSLQKIRNIDDNYNHAISGSINGALLGTGLYGIRKGLGLSVIGLATGFAYKIAGDNIYKISREAWISSRIHNLSTSRPRRLEVHKPLFPPKEGQKINIIPNNNNNKS